MTVREMIYDAMRLVGVIEVGQTGNSDEETELLRALNTMVDAWATEHLTLYAIASGTYTLTSGTASYTIGSGGAFNTARPIKIERAYLVRGTNAEPLEVLTYDQRFQAGVFNNGAYPLATLIINPTPDGSATLQLDTWQVLTAFAALVDTVALPPGYVDAIEYNLALRVAPRYKDAMVSPLVLQQARDAKANIMRINSQVPRMELDHALITPRFFDIMSGSYR